MTTYSTAYSSASALHTVRNHPAGRNRTDHTPADSWGRTRVRKGCMAHRVHTAPGRVRKVRKVRTEDTRSNQRRTDCTHFRWSSRGIASGKPGCSCYPSLQSGSGAPRSTGSRSLPASSGSRICPGRRKMISGELNFKGKFKVT